ncbi:MAG: ABC transporter permease, partial [Cyanobacteria bacterium J06638_22]
PLSFMPRWLQVVASLNPLSYAIEPIRYVYLHSDWALSSIVMQTPFADVSMGAALLLLVGFDAIALVGIRSLLSRNFA